MHDKVVLITGPARGIGEELARQCAARGARLALVGLEPERLAALVQELGPHHVWFESDVTNQASLERAVAGTVSALGGIDVVVANAGIASFGTVAITPADAMARVIDVNLTGVIRTVSTTLAHVVARRGYFLLVSSAAALSISPGLATYAASKAGVEHFGNGLRLELGQKGVAVGTAHPCWTDTDLVNDTRRDLQAFDRMLAKLPGPFGGVTPVRECVAQLVAAIEKRERKVFIPKSLSFFSAFRMLFMSSLGERLLRRDTRKSLERLEREVQELGRSFGEHSVEANRK